MPSKLQTTTNTVTLIFSVLLFLLLLGGLYVLWTVKFEVEDRGQYHSLSRWMLTGGDLRSNLIYSLGSITVLILFSIVSNLSLSSLFGKTASAELFYLILFNTAISLEVFRLGVMLMQVWTMPAFLSRSFTQAVVFGRVMALLVMLLSSLFAVGMKYNHHSTLLAGIFILSVLLASIFPVDVTRYETSFIHKLGDGQAYWTLNIGLAALSLINFLAAAIIRRSRRFLAVGAATILLFLGKELLYWGATPIPLISGALLLLGGTVLFARQIALFYLWI